MVYPGTEVYNRYVMFDFSGVSGSSEYVAYITLSVQDGTLRELRDRGQHYLKSNIISHLPISVNFANLILVRALRDKDIGKSPAGHSRDTGRKTNLELPEFSISQPHKRSPFLPLHPQLVLVFQLFSLVLTMKCGGQVAEVFWSV